MRVTYALISAAVLGSSAMPAQATQLIQTYDVSTVYDLHHGITYNDYGDGAGFTNSFNLDAPGGVVTDPFPKDSGHPPILTYLMATSNLFDIATDLDEDGHLVIAFNPVFAASLLAANADFSDQFEGYDEGELIHALTLLDTPDLAEDDPGRAAQIAAKDAAVDLIFNFSGDVATLGGLTAADGGELTLLSFSLPSAAGTGKAQLTAVPGPVPEPASWAMMVCGFGLSGAAMRRRRAMISFG